MGRVMALLAGASIVLAGVGLLATDWVGGKLPFGHQMFRSDSALLRLVPNASSGAGINPNELAGVLTLLVPVLVLRTVTHQRRLVAVWTVAPTAVAGAMCAFLLLASQSRGGLAGLGAAALAGLGWWLRDQPPSRARRRWLIAYLLLVLASVAVGLKVTAAWVDAPTTSVNQEIDSYSARAEIWRKALSMISDFPMTGIGIGQFNPVFHLLYPSSVLPSSTYVPHAHNLYLDYAVELGLPGALAFAAVVVCSLYECGRASNSSHVYFRWTARGLSLGILAFLVYGLVDAIAPGARGGLVLWVILGLCLAAGTIALEESACPTNRIAQAPG
jgi:putative inorganic carbon (HCO3(-)) transporter